MSSATTDPAMYDSATTDPATMYDPPASTEPSTDSGSNLCEGCDCESYPHYE